MCGFAWWPISLLHRVTPCLLHRVCYTVFVTPCLLHRVCYTVFDDAGWWPISLLHRVCYTVFDDPGWRSSDETQKSFAIVWRSSGQWNTRHCVTSLCYVTVLRHCVTDLPMGPFAFDCDFGQTENAARSTSRRRPLHRVFRSSSWSFGVFHAPGPPLRMRALSVIAQL